MDNQQLPPPTLPYLRAPFSHLLQQQHRHQIQMFWSLQRQGIETANDFKNQQLPLARIKKIMKADEDVHMISAEAPVLFAKACELFILELTLRSWLHAEENKRRTIQKNDIAAAISLTNIFDFLVDIIPRDEIKDEGLQQIEMAASSTTALGLPYSNLSGQPAIISQPAIPRIELGSDIQQLPHPWQLMWQQAVENHETYGKNHYVVENAYARNGHPLIPSTRSQ